MAWLPVAWSLALAAAAPAMLAPPVVPNVATPAADSSEAFDTGLDRVRRMTIPISVNGAGPYHFTIDTGADRSVVSDRLAAELALPAGREVTMHGVTGTQQIATVKVDRIKLGVNETRAVTTPVLPERSLGAVGFLGTDVLAGHSVVLDFRKHRIMLDRSRRDSAMMASSGSSDEITVVARSRFGQLILTDASVNGVKVYAIIDTGAENTIGNPALRRLLLGDRPMGAASELIGVAGGSIPCELASVPRIRLGGMHLGNMPVAYADAATFRRFRVDKVPAILVGMDVLRSFARVAVDFGRREVRFQLS